MPETFWKRNTKSEMAEKEKENDSSDHELLDLSIEYLSRDQITKIINTINIAPQYNIKPIDIDLYRRAFVHSSVQRHVEYSKKYGLKILEPYLESYERLEFIGDAVFNMIVTEYIYNKYLNYDEGFLTRLRSKIICGKTCAEFSKKLGLYNHILMSGVKTTSQNNVNDHILEDVFEAFIGAMYKDLGIKSVEKFIVSLVKDLDFTQMTTKDTNYKDIMMRFTHAENYELPIYELIKQESINNRKHFTSSISLKKNGNSIAKIIGSGTGLTKQESEQEACKNSICYYASNTSEKEILQHYKSCNKIHFNKIKDIIDRVSKN